MERRAIKKAIAKARRPRSRKMMKEPMAEPLARAAFQGPRCNQKSIIEFKRNIPGAFIVDVKSHDGRMVKEDVKVPFGKKVTVFDEIEKKDICLWTGYRIVPRIIVLWPRKWLGASEYPKYNVSDEKNIEAIGELIRRGTTEEKRDALRSLHYAVSKGVDIRGQAGALSNALFDDVDIVRISAANLLHVMAILKNDIREAEAHLRKALEDDNKLVAYYSALALGRMYWNEGNFDELEKLMPLLGKGDRKAIYQTIEQMPDMGQIDPYRQ